VSAAHQGQDIIFSWIQPARIDGDPWKLAEIPLSEIAERYLVKVFSGATVLRDVKVSVPNWGYEAAMMLRMLPLANVRCKLHRYRTVWVGAVSPAKLYCLTPMVENLCNPHILLIPRELN
jgi:hypothetical protein